jgi:hypothetical protein
MLAQGFDFELHFLDAFVSQQKAQGKRDYDERRKQGELGGLEGLPKAGKELNFTPYSAPGMARVNTTLPESNPLFKQETNPTGPAGDENLQVKANNKKVWGQPVQPVEQPAQKAAEPTAPKQEETQKFQGSGGVFKPTGGAAARQPEPLK